MTIDTRHWVYCNLGPLSAEPSSFADDHLQGSGGGVIMTKGTINLKGIFRPAPGSPVYFSVSDGQNWIARIPRKLRVLNSFADPLRNITTVLVGCKFAYMEERKPPVTNLREREANSDVPEIDRRAFTQVIQASTVAQHILTTLGLTAAGTIPFTNARIVDEWDLSGGFIQELGRIAEAECYRCRLNENEQVEFINIGNNNSSNSNTAPLVTQFEIIDLTPQTVGNLPADTVYAKYESTQLKPPDNDPNDPNDEDKRKKRNWEKEESYGQEQYIHSYTNENGDNVQQYGIINTWRKNISHYDLKDRVAYREEESASLMGIRKSKTTFSYYKPLEIFLPPPEPDANGNIPPYTAPPEPPPGDYSEVTSETYTESIPLGEIASSCGFNGPIANFRGLGTAPSAYRHISYDKDEDTGITKTTTTNKVQFISTPFGSDEISKEAQEVNDKYDQYTDPINWGTSITGVINNATWLVEYGSEVRIRTEREYGLQKRPGQQERNKSADQKTPSTEQQAELVWAVGSATSQTALELSPPYVSDDRIIKLGPGLYTVQKSDAAQKALNYARSENRLLLANRSGAGVQLRPVDVPPRPFDLFYVRLNGCTAAYRVNGTSWTFNSDGVIVNVDGLFWGAIDGNINDAWFPLPPGIASLPSLGAVTTNVNPLPANAMAIPSGFNPLNPNLSSLFATLPSNQAPVYGKTLNPTHIIVPYHETVEIVGGIKVGGTIEVQTWIPTEQEITGGVRVGGTIEGYNSILIPGKAISISSNIPAISIGTGAGIPASVISVTALIPNLQAGIAVVVPAATVVVAVLAPDSAGEYSTKVLIPVSNVAMAAMVPAVVVSPVVEVPAVTVAIATIAPDVELTVPGINVPVTTITIAASAPTITTGVAPSLLLPFDGANNSTTFTDQSPNNFALTRNGNAVISTTNPKYGTGSLLLSAAGDYLTTPASSVFAFGTDDFTVECDCMWFSAGNNGLFTFGQLALSVFNGNWYLTNTGSGGNPMGAHHAVNTWAHIAVTRKGSNWRLFMNGTQVGSTITNATNFTGNICYVGMYFSGAYSWNGRIDNFRVIKGFAAYTSNFTPPTGPHPTS